MRILLLTAVTTAALSAAACGGSSEPATPPFADQKPVTLAPASPTSLNGVAGAALSAPVSVRVTLRSGGPAPGVVVAFRVTSSGGAVNPPIATTNDQGLATTTWTLGPATGTQTISATAGDLAPLTFTAFAAAGPPSVLAKSAGDVQAAPAGSAVATTPTVHVLDAAGNGIEGVTVTFTVTSGGGSVSAGVATSRSDGSASPGVWTLGTKLGANTLTATTSGGVTATFTATAVPGPTQTLTFISPAPAELRIGDRVPLAARAFDVYGNENTTTPITYSVSAPAVASVDAAGNLAALAAGPVTVVARSGAASVVYSAIVIGHPAGATVVTSFGTGATPSAITTTDAGIWAITTNGIEGSLSRYGFDGTLLNTPVPVASAALSYLVLAPATTGNTVVVVNIGALSSEYWFVDIAKNAIVDSIITQRYGQFGGMTSDGSRAYMVLDAGELAVIDVAAHKFLPSIGLGAGVENFRIAHGDSLAYAYTSFGTMFEIDLKRSVVKRQFSMPRYTDVDISRDGTLFYALDDPALYVRILQAADLRELRRFSTTGSHIAAAPDGRSLYVTSSGGSGQFVQSFTGDAATGFVLGPQIMPSESPRRLVFDASGGTLFVVNSNGVIDVVR